MTGSVKVANISRHVDSAILSKLFSFLGTVTQLELRPSMINPEVQEALVEFQEAHSIKPALFLSGTELGDRTLVVSEDTAFLPAIGTLGINPPRPSVHAMPLANPSVVAMMSKRTLHAIPANLASVIHPSILQFDPAKAEEISRTIYVGNIASNVVEQQLMDFFSACGPVAYVKMAGDGLQPTRFAFVEFADMPTAQAALQMNGMVLADRPLKVNHSKNAINKPPRPTAAAQAMPMVQSMSQVPTLAAIASLPSSADPTAAMRMHAAGYQQPLALTPTQGQPGAGLAWPILGNVNPAPSEADNALTRRLRELQAHIESKYGPRLAAAVAVRRRYRRSPSRSDRDDRRRAADSRSRQRRRSDDSDDEYYRESRRSRRRSRDDDDWYGRRSRDYRSVLWSKYGLIIKDQTVVFVNILGTLISIYVLLCFWWYSINARHVETRSLLTLVCALLMIAYVDHSSDPWAEDAFGMACCLVTLLFLGSPLSQIGNVIRLRDASVLLPSVALLALFNNLLWSLYGHLHNDAFMLFPNAIGSALCAVQLGLIAYYGRAAANLPLTAMIKPTSDDSDGVESVPMTEIST
ncbi:hypothetical protein IW152_000505 [Coemansia sp. BCRC 34962]|nr:hypothetical protein IW152_000505 [Coemansia sp. BCRC 34962]